MFLTSCGVFHRALFATVYQAFNGDLASGCLVKNSSSVRREMMCIQLNRELLPVRALPIVIVPGWRGPVSNLGTGSELVNLGSIRNAFTEDNSTDTVGSGTLTRARSEAPCPPRQLFNPAPRSTTTHHPTGFPRPLARCSVVIACLSSSARAAGRSLEGP